MSDIYEGEQRFIGDMVELRDGKVRYAKQTPASRPPYPEFANPELVWVWYPGIDPPEMPMGAAEVAAWWQRMNEMTFDVAEITVRGAVLPADTPSGGPFRVIARHSSHMGPDGDIVADEPDDEHS